MRRLLAAFCLLACGDSAVHPSGATMHFTCHQDLNPIAYWNPETGEEFIEFNDPEYGQVQWSSVSHLSAWDPCLKDFSSDFDFPMRVQLTATDLVLCLEEL